MRLESTDALHHRIEGAPTLASAREARGLLDAVFAELAESPDGPRTLEISLGGVRDGNSVLVSLMLVWLRRAREIDVGIRYLDIPPLVMDLIEFTGLDEVLPIAASEGA